MKRILFVDDEPKILEALQRSLRSQRAVWEMVFANSGAEALERIGECHFDVIVTDMRMPEMDGAALLERVMEVSPETIRIILSGYYEAEAALKAVPVAHQYLTKPCDVEKLRETVDKACRCHEITPNAALRRAAGAIGKLPTMPRTSTGLLRALEASEISISEIGEIVERDVGVTAKVLQLANSAFFGLRQEMTSIPMAVGFLGMDTLKQLVLSAEIFRMFRPDRTVEGFSLSEFDRHSHLSARVAAELPVVEGVESAAIVSAVLHDVGMLVLATKLPEQFDAAVRLTLERRCCFVDAEREVNGYTHAEVGAYLMGLWGIPAPVVDAVLVHHDAPEEPAAGRTLNLRAVTYVAQTLASELASPASIWVPGECAGLDAATAERLGIADRIGAWREMAARAAQEDGSERTCGVR